jgi:hypothetical protein
MKKKFGKATQATDGIITRHMHIAFWISKATEHSQNMHYLSLFHSNNG